MMALFLPRIACVNGFRGKFTIFKKASSRFVNRAVVGTAPMSRCFCDETKHGNVSESATSESTLKASLRSKFSAFSDDENEIVLDMSEEIVAQEEKDEMKDKSEEGVYLYQEKKSSKKLRGLFELNLNRGKDGVFDLIDLIQALKMEQVKDVVVIKIPPEKRYCDFLIIGTVKNGKHMTGTLEFLKKLYKLKKSPEDPFIESFYDRQIDHRKSPWQVLDLRNMVLHLFQPAVRHNYDLETLWIVGPEFDDQTIRPPYDPIVDMMQKHIKFIENLNPSNSDNVFVVHLIVIVMASKTLCSYPNVVLFVADDLGYGDLGGAFGNESIPTPNIDKIGMSGTSLTHSLAAASVCTPSRAALLTSRYPIRYGMTSPGRNRVIFFTASSGGLPESEVTLPKILKKIGFNTALIGKWHLGNDQHYKGDMIHHPLKHGFDYFYGLPLSNIKDFGRRTSVVTSYFPNMYYWFWTIAVIGLSLSYALGSRKLWLAVVFVLFITVVIPLIITLFIKSFPIINSILMRNGAVIEQPIVLEGITSRFVNESKSFIDKSIGERNPFFLMMSFVKVHSAHFPSVQFKGKSMHGLYGDCVMELDWGVGEIISHIEESNIIQDTIIIFTSDNGGHVEEFDENGVQEGGYNGVLRGGKGHGAMEGGIRVPTLISWPNHIPKNKIINTPVSLMDLFPTILEAMKQPIPENIDGKSLLPLLTQKSKVSPHKFLFHYCGTYLHGVTHFQDSGHIWKVYFYTPKFINDHEYRCEFMCQCYGRYVIKHSPPKIYNLAVDITEKEEIAPSSNTYQYVVKEVDNAIRHHELSLNMVESQFSFKNAMWRPDLQLCCKFPLCTCREFGE